MNTESNQALRRERNGELLLSVILWLAFICAVTAGAYKRGELVHSVTDDYRAGVIRWFEGRSLYSSDDQLGFVLYAPPSYILMAPLVYCPGFWGELLWRLFTVGLWGYAVLRLAERMKRCAAGPHYFWFTLITMVLSLPAARNGQCTIPMAAAMLLASMALFDKRWNNAAVWLTLGLFLKPHIVPIFLLTFVLFAPMRWRLVVAAAVFAVIPFFFQDANYVWEQWRAYPQIVQAVSKSGEVSSFASFYQLCKFCGFKLSLPVWTSLRVASAVLVLGLCFLLIRHRNESYYQTIWYYALPTFFLLLMNARTENNAYAMLAPIFVSYLMMESCVKKNVRLTAFLVLLLIGLAGHYEIGKFITTRDGIVSICPFLTLVFLVYLGFRRNVWFFAEK